MTYNKHLTFSNRCVKKADTEWDSPQQSATIVWLSFKKARIVMYSRIVQFFISVMFTLIAFNCVAVTSFEKAQLAYENYQFNTAKILVKQLIAEQPDNLPAKILLIEILLAEGDGHLAEVAIKQINTRNVDKGKLNLLQVEAFIAQGNFNDALSLLEQPIFINVNQDILLHKQGVANIGLGHFKLAKSNFLQAISLNESNIDAQLGLAQIHLIEHNYDTAQQLLEQISTAFLPPIKVWSMLATVYIHQGKLEQALSTINAALNENPNDVNSLAIRASINIQFDQLKQADEDLERALNVNQFEPRLLFLKAVIAARSDKNRQKDATFDELKRIIENLPSNYLRQNPSYYYMASFVHFLENNVPLAKQYIQAYLKIDPKSLRAMLLSATIDMQQNDFTAAISTLKKASLVAPDDTQLLTMLGSAYLAIENESKALLYLQQAYQQSPENLVTNAEFAKALIASNQLEEAVKVLKNSTLSQATFDQSLALNNLLVSSLLQLDKTNEAIEVVNSLINEYPGSSEFLKQAGILSRQQGNNEQALQYFDKAITVNANDWRTKLEKAELLFSINQAKQAVNLLIATTAEQPENINIMLALSDMFRKLGALKQSYLWAEKALATAPDDFSAIEAFALLNVYLNRTTEAIEVVSRFAAGAKPTFQLAKLLGELYRFSGQSDAALETYQNTFKLPLTDNQKAFAYHQIANLYANKNDYTNALIYYKRATAWQQSPTIITDIVNLHRTTGNSHLALETLRANPQFQHLENMQLMLGQVLIELTQYKEATKVLSKINENNLQAKVSLVHALLNQGNVEKAKNVIDKGLTINPDNALLKMSLAEINLQQKNWTQADLIYQELVSEHPTAAILNNAAYIALQTGQFAKAKSLAQRSVDQQDNSADSLDTLGLALFHLKQYEQALPHFRKALVIDNNRADIKFHIAQTLMALNRNREGISLLAEAVNSRMKFDGKEEAKRILEAALEER